MTNSARPFAAKKCLEINGVRMAYIDEGEGAPIVFAHGNPTSSYLWRNVMPACRGLGRLIACDMIGMGDSEKLPDSGPDRYTYAEQRSFLFALWKNLGVDKDVVFVLHDAGALLGFDWTRQHPEGYILPSSEMRKEGGAWHIPTLGGIRFIVGTYAPNGVIAPEPTPEMHLEDDDEPWS